MTATEAPRAAVSGDFAGVGVKPLRLLERELAAEAPSWIDEGFEVFDRFQLASESRTFGKRIASRNATNIRHAASTNGPPS